MATCTDNDATGRRSCGATFGGERQHCVARVPWSTQPDGRAHITAAISTIEAMWRRGGSAPAHPAECGFVELEPGRWGSLRPEDAPGGARELRLRV